MRKFGWLGIAALALAVGGTAQAETVKIGVVLPFSGANADLGHQIDKAFDLNEQLRNVNAIFDRVFEGSW